MNRKTTDNSFPKQERLVLAIEMAILKYGRNHSEFIVNPYQWFARKLGYKSKNYIYKWFNPESENIKIGFDDVKEILKITQDKILLEVAKEELESMIIINPVSLNQLKFFE